LLPLFSAVNLKPVLTGHVLVAPVRASARRLTDLADHETAALFVTARKVQAMLERHYGVRSASVAVQDGPDAGQTVEVLQKIY
jgi:bis(5'-adenosyl)-triphosphatase